MEKYIASPMFKQLLLIFVILPVYFYFSGDFQDRSLLKEAISLVTIIGFLQLVSLFFLVPRKKSKDLTAGKIIKLHKKIGYLFVVILLIHPFLVILPRFFEAGISPVDAFYTMVTTMNIGVVLGLISWLVLLVLGLTSFFRNSLSMEYATWKVMHGILAILFVVLAAWHTIDLGRHSDFIMRLLIIATVLVGVTPLCYSYIRKYAKK